MESPIESAKRSAAHKAVEENYPVNPQFVGIGSGSTIVYVVEAIRDSKDINPSVTKFVPTGSSSRKVIETAGLTPIAFDDLPEGTILDLAFDGADECDEELNLIKGGGACLFQEKLVATQSRKFVCVAGKSLSAYAPSRASYYSLGEKYLPFMNHAYGLGDVLINQITENPSHDSWSPGAGPAFLSKLPPYLPNMSSTNFARLAAVTLKYA